MSDRLINLAGALGALVVVYLLLVPPERQAIESRPTTADRGESGLFAVWTWLRQAGLQTRSLRTRLSTIDDLTPETGNVLVMVWPFQTEVSASEFDHLRAWLARGNTLLLLAALHDTPIWSQVRPANFDVMLAALTLHAPPDAGADAPGRTRGSIASGDARATREFLRRFQDDAPAPARYAPTAVHALTRDTGTITLPVTNSRFIHIDHPDASAVTLIEDGDRPLLVYAASPAIPNGVFIVTHSGFMSNGQIARPGHGNLINNLLDVYLQPRGKVVFDDFHQGLSALYDPSAFLSDPRLKLSIAALLFLWLVYMVAFAARLGPLSPRVPNVDTARFIHQTGQFFARHTRVPEINAELLRGFNNRYRQSTNLPITGETVIDLVQDDPRLSAADREDYALLVSDIARQHKVRPLEVHRRIVNLETRL